MPVTAPPPQATRSVPPNWRTTCRTCWWNAEFQQFTDRFGPQDPARYFGFASGPELAGYVPWYFNLPDTRFDSSWRNLTDPDKFAGAHGLHTIYPSSPYYLVQHRTPGQSPGECEWNGPSWPFQTSQVLTGLANLLNDHFALQNVAYHGHRVSVVYDRVGSRYRSGLTGLSIWIDGEPSVSGGPLTGARVDISRATEVPAPRAADTSAGSTAPAAR
nr:hypothetical protein OH826_02750 [Streptomyces sp. NBC_00899]WSX81070.1 hypothetical protein OH826_48760 [Streptomyces sp. NBC_00899]